MRTHSMFAGAKLAQQLPELLAQHEIRLHLLVSLRVDERQVHRIAHFAGEQIRRDDLRNLDAALSCASFVLAPKCGVNTTFGSLRKGCSAGNGSSENTSSAAPATFFDSSAAI